ncbi:MAG: hypothetical protein AABX70_00070 [Nanoarchaeota archaeon]
MASWLSTAGTFDASGPLVTLIPAAYRADVTLFLWGGLILVLLSAYFSVRKIEENLTRVMGLYLFIGLFSYALTGHLSTTIFFGGIIVVMHFLSRLRARRQEFGSGEEQALADRGAGSPKARQNIERVVRVEEGLAQDPIPEVAAMGLEGAREAEEAEAELSVEGGAVVLPEAELELLDLGLKDEVKVIAHEERLKQIASAIAGLQELPQTVQASMDLTLEFLHELVLASEGVVESEKSADQDRLRVISKMEKVLGALKKAARRAQAFKKEEQAIEGKLGKLGSKKIREVSEEITKKEKRLDALKEDKSAGQELIISLRQEIKSFGEGYESLQRAERVLSGLRTQLGNYLTQTKEQLGKIASTVNNIGSVEKTLGGFEARQGTLKEKLAKEQGKFASVVVDLGHDKLEGFLQQVDELVVRSKEGMSSFFDAWVESKKALFTLCINLKSFLEQVTALAAETHGLESLSAASAKLQDQVTEGFAQLEGLAEKLLGNNPVVEAELEQITRLSKQTEAQLLQGVEVENNMFERTMSEVELTQKQINAFQKGVEEELQSLEQTKNLTFSSLDKIIKLVAVKTEELSSEVTRSAAELSSEMASTAAEVGEAKKVA